MNLTIFSSSDTPDEYNWLKAETEDSVKVKSHKVRLFPRRNAKKTDYGRIFYFQCSYFSRSQVDNVSM